MDIIDRLHEIANAIADANYSELTMRIPAEPDRDADLVVSSAAREIARLRAELAEVKRDAERYRHLLRHHIRSDPDMSGRHHWMTLGRGIGRGATAGEAIDAALKGEGNA